MHSNSLKNENAFESENVFEKKGFVWTTKAWKVKDDDRSLNGGGSNQRVKMDFAKGKCTSRLGGNWYGRARRRIF